MKQKIAIYLAGTIKKGHEDPNDTFWSEKDISSLREHLSQFEVAFLNPAFRSDDLSDQLSVFGRDMVQVFCSHVVLVDARNRRGLGVGAEMMWAKVNRIPVITWAPKDSHYNKERGFILGVPIRGYVHPFVESLSDRIAEDLAEASLCISQLVSAERATIKGIEQMSKAMQHYTEKQLAQDEPMKHLLQCELLSQRLNRKHPSVV